MQFTRIRKEQATIQKITTFLMFTGKAEEAMNLYMSLFDGSAVLSISRYGAEGPGAEGSVIHASFTLAGQEIMCSDSYIQHGFTFTPSMSLWVNCGSEAELDSVFSKLAEGGMALMPLDNYGFSSKFGWVQDRYGVSWQLNLP